MATEQEGARLIDNIRNISMSGRRLKAQWCSDSHVALQLDTVTVEFGDEPGVSYRLHPTTGGIEPIMEAYATRNATSWVAWWGLQWFRRGRGLLTLRRELAL